MAAASPKPYEKCCVALNVKTTLCSTPNSTTLAPVKLTAGGQRDVTNTHHPTGCKQSGGGKEALASHNQDQGGQSQHRADDKGGDNHVVLGPGPQRKVRIVVCGH